MDRIHLISVFVSVVDTGGFAGAARKLQLSPPAVTRAVNELEASLGVRLLTRTTRVVRVTEAGARYAEDCRRILADLVEADRSVSGLHSSPRGRLTVTAPGWLGALYITPIVTEYLHRYPEVTATCWFLDRMVNLIEEGVDVAIRVAELPDSSMQASRVGSMRLVMVASPEYLERRGEPRTIAELEDHDIVMAGAVAPGAELRLRDQGQLRAVRVRPRMSTTNNETAVAATASGFGITQQMLYKVAKPLAQGKLKIILPKFEPAPLPVSVLHREGRHPSQKVRAFLDLLIQRLRENPAMHDTAES